MTRPRVREAFWRRVWQLRGAWIRAGIDELGTAADQIWSR